MKKASYFLLFIITLGVLSVVNAESISINDIIAKFQAKNYVVTNKVDGTNFVVNTGTESIEYTYNSSDNTLSYSVGIGKEVKTVVDTDDVLVFIVELSSNKDDYINAKNANPKPEGVNYGTGCDLLNMGFCYDSSNGIMQVAVSNQFTTFLYNYYTGNSVSDATGQIDGDTARESADPVYVDESGNPQDSGNPDTGSFTEVGIIIGLLTLLLIVISLKKHNETEFKI